MAYMNQERKAVRAAAIKVILKQYGLKGSVAVRNHMTLVLNIKSGVIDFIGNYKETVSKLPDYTGNTGKMESISVNPYHYDRHFSGVAVEVIEKLVKAMYGADYFDNSDVQSDYFDTSHYIDVNIGQWDKPYQLTV